MVISWRKGVSILAKRSSKYSPLPENSNLERAERVDWGCRDGRRLLLLGRRVLNPMSSTLSRDKLDRLGTIASGGMWSGFDTPKS